MANGRRGGFTRTFNATPTITAGLYAAGDLIGGKIEIPNAARHDPPNRRGGIVQYVLVADLGKQDSALDVVFFDSDPDATTFTDNATFTVADADLAKIAGIAEIAAGDYVDFVDNSAGQAIGLAIPMDLGKLLTLYAAIVSRGTPTYTSTADLILRVGVLQD